MNGADAEKMIDRFLEADRRRLNLLEARRIRAEATKPFRCGDCSKWMKSRICPKEKNVNGYSRGPSMNGITCSEFEVKRTSQQIRDDRLKQAEALELANTTSQERKS